MRTSVLNVELSDSERALLEAASEQIGVGLSDFVRRKAVEAAEAEVLERRNVTIPREHRDAFEAWARRPGRSIPGLEELSRTKPVWER